MDWASPNRLNSGGLRPTISPNSIHLKANQRRQVAVGMGLNAQNRLDPIADLNPNLPRNKGFLLEALILSYIGEAKESEKVGF